MRGADILAKAKMHLGEAYILGAHAPLSNKNWTGPWDCAEYASWLAYQTYGIVYGSGTTGLTGADPYSGFWAEDAKTRGVKVTVADATNTPGAFLVRFPVNKPVKRIGHVAISDGTGQVYEAAGKAFGVRIGKVAGRRWDVGVFLPDVNYGAPMTGGGTISPALPLILRQEDNPAFDEKVAELQRVMKQKGFDPGKVDGQFGPATEAAVYAFQLTNGLLPDGEVGPITGTALSLPYWPDGNGADPAGGQLKPAQTVVLSADSFGTVVNTSTDYSDIQAEYGQLFESCVVKDKNGEIAELAGRIAANRDRYESLVASFADTAACGMPWFLVAVIHAMEASGDVGRFKTHLHNGDPLEAPTVHEPKNRPRPNGSNFTWDESARDALSLMRLDKETDWSVPRLLYRLELYNGMGPRKRGHASAYLWSYSNHYTKGKFVADHVWDDDAVSKQPGAASILKQLVDDGTVAVS